LFGCAGGRRVKGVEVTRSTWRFSERITPIRANIVGPTDVESRR
jgi:hypothetical protein